MPITPNTTILNAKYRSLHLTGEGGMGRVWLTEDVRLGRRVAIKEPRSGRDWHDGRGIVEQVVTIEIIPKIAGRTPGRWRMPWSKR